MVVTQVFSMYLLVLGLAWYIFLHLDLLRHNRNIKKHEMHLSTESELLTASNNSIFLKHHIKLQIII